MELDTAKGMRDILPEEQMMREDIKRKFETLFSSYGFVPLDTPLIERYDILSAKFGAGEESDAMSETYRLKDNGGRELGLRFDLTVPLSRYVGMNRTLKLPFKRYQFGTVYRDAPIKEGRYREFTQCDVDIIGSKNMVADATCIAIAKKAYEQLGVAVQIKVNNRKFLFSLLIANGIPEDKVESAVMSIDKLDKYDKETILKETTQKGLDEDAVRKVIDLINVQGSNEEKLTFFENMLKDNEGLQELRDVLSYFPDDADVVFLPTLARGLGYYTGTVFEVVDASGTLDSSIGGGGRYDKLIGNYLSMNKDYPAVGFSFGLDRIVYVLKKLGNIAEQKTRVQVLVVPMNTVKESFSIAQELRTSGLNVDIDMMGRGLSKNLTNANALGIPYAVIVGENELAAGKVMVKDLKTGESELLTIKQVLEKISET
jgi:histidyl-tRNA synthetase